MPKGWSVVEIDGIGDAQVPLQYAAEHSFERTVLAYDLKQRLLELRDQNGGTLSITFYVNVGPDGSSGHKMYKTVTNSSILTGRCILTSFNPIQFVTDVQGKTIILHSNVLAAASDSILPLRIWMVPETGR